MEFLQSLLWKGFGHRKTALYIYIYIILYMTIFDDWRNWPKECQKIIMVTQWWKLNLRQKVKSRPRNFKVRSRMYKFDKFMMKIRYLHVFTNWCGIFNYLLVLQILRNKKCEFPQLFNDLMANLKKPTSVTPWKISPTKKLLYMRGSSPRGNSSKNQEILWKPLASAQLKEWTELWLVSTVVP